MHKVSDKREAQTLVDLLARKGLTHAVISPGSRHAPISLSLHAHPDITCFVVPDERAAAYFALGIAQHTRTAVAVVCTSGTATLNYGPAIAEAFYQELPLIAITADRPPEWVDQGDGQTIRQSGVHDLHVLASFDLRSDANHTDVHRHNERMINHAWNLANGPTKGPVHLNVPLREPLYGMTEGLVAQGGMIEHSPPAGLPDAATLERLRVALHSFNRVMVIPGMHPPAGRLNTAVNLFASAYDAVVLTETGSNLTGDAFVPCIDRLLMSLDEAGEEHLVPDVLITFGSNIVSKKIKAFLRTRFTGEHWHIDPTLRQLDTFKRLSHVIGGDPSSVLEALTPTHTKVKTPYGKHWFAIDRRLSQAFKAIANQTPWSDLLAFTKILNVLPADSVLQMGNSSVVRYIQLFDQRADLSYYGNRGTSGIDGCTATASGMAAVNAATVTLISGDIAFLYDINGLWHNGERDRLKVIIINNGGGNIFKIIEGPSSTDALEELFEARHSLDARHIANHFGIAYRTAETPAELDQSLNELYAVSGCEILEVFTRDVANEELLRHMFKKLRQFNTSTYGTT